MHTLCIVRVLKIPTSDYKDLQYSPANYRSRESGFSLGSRSEREFYRVAYSCSVGQWVPPITRIDGLCFISWSLHSYLWPTQPTREWGTHP